MLTASLPLILFTFAGLFSPGPNVVLLATSGARFGFRATVPHLLGVPVGTGIVAATTALGVGAALLAAPELKFTLQLVAAGWILYLAWRMAQAGRAGRAQDRGRPFTFVEAILFQAVNPKLWAVTLAAAAGFGVGLGPGAEVLRLFLVFCGLNLGVCLFWTTVGHGLRGFLADARRWRIFMTAMALLMAASAALIFV